MLGVGVGGSYSVGDGPPADAQLRAAQRRPERVSQPPGGDIIVYIYIYIYIHIYIERERDTVDRYVCPYHIYMFQR